MTKKGKLSPELSAVLHNKEAREKLRHAMDTGRKFTVRIGDTTYRVSTLRNSRTTTPRTVGSEPTSRGKRLAKT
jgi:hypothetical protein